MTSGASSRGDIRSLNLFKAVIAVLLAILTLILFLRGPAVPGLVPPATLAPTASVPTSRAPVVAPAQVMSPTPTPTTRSTATSSPSAKASSTGTSTHTQTPTATPTASPTTTSTPTVVPPTATSTLTPTVVPTATLARATRTPAATRHTTEQLYTVQPGDSLYSVAERFYGVGDLWPLIRDATNARAAVDPTVKAIGAGRVLRPGQKLVIPAR